MTRSSSTSKSSSTTTKRFPSSKASASSSSKKVTSSTSSNVTASKQQQQKKVKSAAEDNKKELSGLYGRLYKDAKKKMGPPIHRDGMDDIETILLQFDHEESFGPCSRISRLERFERAQKLGLNPDPEIGDILRSQEGKNRKEYSESVFAHI
ncbi:hypothetical protein JCM5350_005240 [Sporobolomyces pararoseus]